ncbi:MAG TPA: adenylate/guanylate cyclase domain-containing protein [Salinivirga sp.]|uniref:adenylate/guanylate cyclase domain-containing protein n=1 Tax=Salinivirga sp. TaxID=1970192 RepID=UPI002B496CD2|nr:adenylate/guanylate cyclase domain-containing protein [Salinivirga sp.]HKK58011.1 adenylate/guanylate cyclase domain-containing protein [Salinivirga sp.]
MKIRLTSIFLLLFSVLTLQASNKYKVLIENHYSKNVKIVKTDSLWIKVQIPENAQYRFHKDSQWQQNGSNMAGFYSAVNADHILYIKHADGKIEEARLIVKQQRVLSIWFWISALLFLLSLIWLIVRYFKYRFSVERLDLELRLQKTTERMIEQRQSYEAKLAERLPKEEVEELKVQGKSKRYKMVTVLFSDVSGFSKLTSKDNPDKLVDDLDKFFYKFDQTVKKYNIQKIKTVGDTYMCAGGIPKKNRTNPIEVVLAALEMQQYIDGLKSKYPDSENRIWGLRIGIHTGPVFAGKEGLKKQSFDIWGETVNIASRMESSGEIGKTNISGNTYELIRDYFICNYHGKMPVKYRGDVDMYFIEGFRPNLSVNKQGFIPNEDFYIKLAFIRFDDLEEEVMDLLERQLPDNLAYHNLKHTIDVVTQVELIGRQEKISERDMLLLKTAALFHDTGFTRGYKDHELLGIQIAREILPRFHYSEEQIEAISDLIYATKLPPKPKNKLEMIICDADLDYLGRADFIPVSETLFRELVEHKFIEDDYDKWNQIQIKFIESHQYFTDTAKRLRDVNKKKQLENIRKQLKK